MIGRILCLAFGHVPDKVWLNDALGLDVENPDRPGTGLPTPAWERFGGGDVFLCPRCRVVFMPVPRDGRLRFPRLYWFVERLKASWANRHWVSRAEFDEIKRGN